MTRLITAHTLTLMCFTAMQGLCGDNHMRAKTAEEVLDEAIVRNSTEKAKKVLWASDILIQTGIKEDTSLSDEEISQTVAEERKALYHEIKYWMEAFRSVRMEAEAKIAAREEIFGRSEYFESIQEEYLQTLHKLEKVVDALPKWCKDGEGEKYRAALRIRYIDGERPCPKAWEKIGFSRSYYFAIINKGLEKVQEFYFGDSHRELSRLLTMKIAKL